MDYVKIFLRIVTILPMFLAITLLTGRRKIGELPVFDFLSLITVAAVVGADIADPDIEHLPTGFAVIIIMLLHYIYSLLIIRHRKFGKLITFEPVVVIEKGQLVKGNMKRLKYSLDNVLTLLREKDVFDIGEVEYAIVESTGQLSVLKKSQYQPVTPIQINIKTGFKGLSIPLIVEGKVYEENLAGLGLNEAWLNNQLSKSNIESSGDVFFAAVNTEGTLYVSRGLDEAADTASLRH